MVVRGAIISTGPVTLTGDEYRDRQWPGGRQRPYATPTDLLPSQRRCHEARLDAFGLVLESHPQRVTKASVTQMTEE
jgi:hypothetical protein